MSFGGLTKEKPSFFNSTESASPSVFDFPFQSENLTPKSKIVSVDPSLKSSLRGAQCMGAKNVWPRRPESGMRSVEFTMTAPNVRISFEADIALRRGEKLQAVKITRERLGLSLKDAKDLCDAWSPNDPVPPAPDPADAPAPRAALNTGELPATAVEALRRGNKIEAIKCYREATGEGLKESKEAVEAYESSHPALAPAPACETRSCGAGRLFLALLALGLIAAAVYFSGVWK